MIENILEPLVCGRFLTEEKYREGHLRILNVLPARRVMGLHVPEMKSVAKKLSHSAEEYIERFVAVPRHTLFYEEMVVWGYLINMCNCTLEQRFNHLHSYVPVLDNWAVCDSYCAHAKWMAKVDRGILWSFLAPYFDSLREFEVRFGIVASMCYMLDEEWLNVVFERIDSIDFERITSEYHTVKRRPERVQTGAVQGASPYYVRMAVAWLLATALAKFPEQTRAFVAASSLPDDVIRLYVRKARESFRTRNVAPL